MKLLLSSCDFRNEHSFRFINDNIGKPIDHCKVLYFPNEKSTEDIIYSGIYEARLNEFGFKTENIYVFNYWDPERFFDLTIDAIYISGGNTFGTLKRIREAKADSSIIEYVNRGAVYIGGSAGAHIACSDISHVSFFDTNSVGLTDCKGLGLCDIKLICHYNENRRLIYDKLKEEDNRKVIALTNDEYILVE